jgi:hypothetical protein
METITQVTFTVSLLTIYEQCTAMVNSTAWYSGTVASGARHAIVLPAKHTVQRRGK